MGEIFSRTLDGAQNGGVTELVQRGLGVIDETLIGDDGTS
jgi:hypothetical protein